MSELRALMEVFSEKTGNELRDICRDNLEKLQDYFDETNAPDDFRANYAQGIWKLFVSADRRTRGDEYNLFIYSIGFTEEEFSKDAFFEMTNHGSDPDFVDWMVATTQKMPKSIHYAVCTIGLCILGVDEEVTDEEEALLERLLG